MRKMFKKFLAFIIITSLILTSSVTSRLKIANAENLFQNSSSQKVTIVDELYKESQVKFRFPEENPTSRKYARYKRVFKAYEGRGNLIIENHGAQTAEIYVNGYYVPINDALSSQNGIAQVDIGKYTHDGENTLEVVNVTPANSYINVKVLYPELVYGKPEDVGVDSSRFNIVDRFINAEISQGFPGAALIVIKDGKIIKNTAYGTKMAWDGYNKVENPEQMTVDTLFDLASNTKMFATNLALMKLVSEGKIKVTDLVSKYLDNFEDGPNDVYKGKATITLEDLMKHRAGFSADIHYFNPKTANNLYSQDKETTIKMLSKTPLSYTPRSKTLYSDVDYMILGVVVEKVTGMPLDEYVENNIYKPLGLKNTVFNPLKKGFSVNDCAATERNGNTRDGSVYFPNIRTSVIRGQVHDEKAFYCMDGVSGHAGLFSTTHDLAVLAQLILNGGGYGGYKLCDKNTLAQFIKPSDEDNAYGLGWDRNADNEAPWEFGAYASELTIGHTGWTGTVTCIDPKKDMAIILLTNQRNCPCPNGVFDTSAFETGRYGSILTMVEEAILNKGYDNGAGLIQAAKDQIAIAQSSKTVLSTREAQATIDILPEGAIKDQLEYELFVIQTTVDPSTALNKAINMVQKAKSSLKQSDIDIAEKYINALQDGKDKDMLKQKIDIIKNALNTILKEF
ncbi:penicillin binding protein PBP4B [Caloramator sp. E03]|uniref:penicillin binding protein PBP4B n=1 Tax=Caloramator sp. E03 TaxID=2576307 RepID=UPI001110AD93|nr:penicillin binding protein PBP4B [Caloramator sp. E03]QCX34328.1 penicillin binding protein PBP4B [Caloramator sp. E03]